MPLLVALTTLGPPSRAPRCWEGRHPMGAKFDRVQADAVQDLLAKPAWHEERKMLRDIVLGCKLVEEVRWGKLCYTFEGNNVAIIYGLKSYCALGFLKGILLKDAKGLLHKPGENSQSARWFRFTALQEIQETEPILKTYIQEAIEVERSGAKVEFKAKRELVFAKELLGKFKDDPVFKAAFTALTPGRQRGYNLLFSEPKQSKTRIARIEKNRQRILDGKGRQDR